MGGDLPTNETYVGDREKNKHSRKKLCADRGIVGMRFTSKESKFV